MDLMNNALPVIGRWVVKYDDKFGMPQFVQGRLIGEFSGCHNGQSIVVKDILSMDLRAKTLKTYDGQEWKLVGAGKRMILLNEDEVLEIALREDDEIED